MKIITMWSRMLLVLISVAAMLALAGCFSLKQPAQRIDHYLLEYDPPALTVDQVLPAVIRVEPFTASPVYQSNRMFFKPGPYLSDAYYYHRWRAAPGDMLTYFIARDLQQSQAFKAAGPATGLMAFTHTLQGMVDEFYEDDGPPGSPGERAVVVAVTIALLTDSEIDLSQQVLLQQQFKARHLSSRKHPQAFAEAMSLAVRSLSHQIMEAVAKALESTPADGAVAPAP